MQKFDGKVAIITGASGGMGKAVALKLAELGASISLVDISEKGMDEVIKSIEEKGGNAIFVKADVSSVSDVKNYVKETVNKFGKIDLFFNNAGIQGDFAKLADQTDEQINQLIDINLKGVAFGMKYVIPELLKSGGGSIVNTASGAIHGGTVNMSPYSASKHGVVGFTKSAALEYGKENIRINGIAPGSTETPFITNLGEEAVKGIEDAHPLGRLAQPEEMADVVIYLFGENSSFINGEIITVDGGSSVEVS